MGTSSTICQLPRTGLTTGDGSGDRGSMPEQPKSLVPYVAGFVMCVGAVLALVACTGAAVAGVG